MERLSIDAVQAFALLKQLSQSTNTPLRIIAQRVITTR
jgi:AmiR/NasT family two-component response regulator